MMKDKCELCGDPAYKEVETPDCGLVTMCEGCCNSYIGFCYDGDADISPAEAGLVWNEFAGCWDLALNCPGGDKCPHIPQCPARKGEDDE